MDEAKKGQVVLSWRTLQHLWNDQIVLSDASWVISKEDD